MNKYKKRYQKINNYNKNKRANNSDEISNKEQGSNIILHSSTYTWQNYCKNCTWMYNLMNSVTLITNILFISLLTINGLSWKIFMEGSLSKFIKSYDWLVSSLNETTKDLIAFYYHPTTVYQMIPIMMGFIFSYIWDFFRVWLDLLTHGIVLVILLYKPLGRKNVLCFYFFHGLCYYLTGDIWGFKLIDFIFSWRYTLINFCENILAGSINSDKDFLQWFKSTSENRRRQHEMIDSCELEGMNNFGINSDFLTMDTLDTNNILFTFLSELINKYSRKFCVVGPISWVWIWILGLKIWYSSWIIENIKDLYTHFRDSLEKNIILNIIHWKYLEMDDTVEKPISPVSIVSSSSSSSSRNSRVHLQKKIYNSSADFAAAKAYILNNNKSKNKKFNSHLNTYSNSNSNYSNNNNNNNNNSNSNNNKSNYRNNNIKVNINNTIKIL
ncbi:hypothetical protein U3516DRAFT_261032 [Neocallimastix sp. 'constans']